MTKYEDSKYCKITSRMLVKIRSQCSIARNLDTCNNLFKIGQKKIILLYNSLLYITLFVPFLSFVVVVVIQVLSCRSSVESTAPVLARRSGLAIPTASLVFPACALVSGKY